MRAVRVNPHGPSQPKRNRPGRAVGPVRRRRAVGAGPSAPLCRSPPRVASVAEGRVGRRATQPAHDATTWSLTAVFVARTGLAAR